MLMVWISYTENWLILNGLSLSLMTIKLINIADSLHQWIEHLLFWVMGSIRHTQLNKKMILTAARVRIRRKNCQNKICGKWQQLVFCWYLNKCLPFNKNICVCFRVGEKWGKCVVPVNVPFYQNVISTKLIFDISVIRNKNNDSRDNRLWLILKQNN